MAITERESLGYYSKDGHSPSNTNSGRSLPTCRLANHHISAQRVTIIDHNTHYDKMGIADQYNFIVRCHRCNLEWIELWRTSKWFMQKNNCNKIAATHVTMR
jgi:hypothetical protein